MATILINSVDDVFVDGAPANAFSDAVRNLPEVVSKDFQDALRTFIATKTDAVSVAKYTEAAALAKEAIETGDETKKTEALAKIEEAKVPAKDRLRAELEKQRDDIIARLAAIGAGTPETIAAAQPI